MNRRHACGYPLQVYDDSAGQHFVSDCDGAPEWGETLRFCPGCGREIKEIGVLTVTEWREVELHDQM